MSHKQLTLQALGRAVGVHWKTVSLWIRDRADAPKSRDVEEWKAYIEKNGLGKSGPKVAESSQELKDESVRHDILLKKAKLDRENRRVIARDEVSRLLLHIANQQRSRLYQFLETEAPPKLDGMSAVQMRPILREFADGICDTMAKLVDDFNAA